MRPVIGSDCIGIIAIHLDNDIILCRNGRVKIHTYPLVATFRFPKDNDDPVKIIIGNLKYSSLNSQERNQLALDIYLRSRTKWQIGRDYERYIGFIYESEGFDVSYQGIIEGYEDLGRDLICKKGDSVKVVQCKCWSKHKVIREKHINQLYGTTIKYMIDQGISLKKNYNNSLFPIFESEVKITPVFITSTEYSQVAISFANALGVELIEKKKLDDYPMIKCNTSQNGERIYHLPFDQQYDNTKINKQGCFYVATVAEAEEKGFRRAYRWTGK